MTQDATPATPAFAVPNFREDERVAARYASMIERRIKTFGVEHESTIRRNASTKREELREELETANAEWERCNEAAEAAREAYRAAYPNNVTKMRLVAPSMADNMRSLGAAGRLYHEADEAWRAAEAAASNLRRIEHNENQVDVELAKAIERAPQVVHEVTTSEKWIAEIHAEEELANVKSKIDEIAAEREAYAKRLAAGSVSPDELRLRSFAERDIKHVAVPATGVIFERVEAYGPKTYFILRDLKKQRYSLPYDRRLEAVLDSVFDFVQSGKDVEVRRTLREDGRTPMSVLDHFVKCSDDPVAAQDAYRVYQKAIRENRMFNPMTELDDLETTLIGLLAAIAAKSFR